MATYLVTRLVLEYVTANCYICEGTIRTLVTGSSEVSVSEVMHFFLLVI